MVTCRYSWRLSEPSRAQLSKSHRQLLRERLSVCSRPFGIFHRTTLRSHTGVLHHERNASSRWLPCQAEDEQRHVVRSAHLVQSGVLQYILHGYLTVVHVRASVCWRPRLKHGSHWLVDLNGWQRTHALADEFIYLR